MITKHLLLPFLITICCMLNTTRTNGQHLDEVFFGNALSEQQHGIASFDLSKSEVYTGQAGLTARRFLPNTINPYQGVYTGIYGGEIHFVMKVDSSKQNYFTAKLSGDENSAGRIILNVEGMELGSRHGGDEELFWGEGTAVSPGAFFYRTAPIPRTLTDGKTIVTIRLRSSGSFYAYGTPWVYNSYQKPLTTSTCGIYRAYLHTNPAFVLPADDVQGVTPSYATAPASPASNLATIKANVITSTQNKITSLLNGSDYIPTDPNNFYNDIEVLGIAYNQPYNVVAYHNAAVITKIRTLIDNLVVNSNNGTQTAPGAWGGAFGRPAFAVSLVYDAITGLDDVVNLGSGAGLTRRQQWINIFKASFNTGGTNRKTITNQEMENSMSVYGAALGLFKLDPVNFSEYPKVALHHVLEACGIEEFTGNMTNINTNNPALGTPAPSEKGAGYFYMTQKGSSHEPGWVAPDCYGNLGPKIIEFWKMTQSDPNVTLDGNGNGDKRLLAKAVQHNLFQSRFTYPWTINGKKAILSEGAICWRNVYIPGKEFYGQAIVAGAANDPVSMGYMKQMAEDGLFDFDTENPRMSSMHYLPAAIDAIIASGSTSKLPSTPGQPDYVSADEENGVVAVKNGNERVFVTFYDRAYSDNRIVKAHHITTTTERKIEFKPDKSEYASSGQFKLRGPSIAGVWSGEAPDAPISGYAGQKEFYPSYNRTTSYHTDRCISEFYQATYGKYMIAMNTTTDLTKTIDFPAEMIGKSGYDIATGTTIIIPATLSISPRTTKVFYVATANGTTGLMPDTRPVPSGVVKTMLADSIAFTETFATLDTTIAKVNTSPLAGNYKHDLFNTLIQQIAFAKYTSQDGRATQANVDTAKNRLMAAYYALAGNKYLFSTNTLASGIYFIKIPLKDSFYTRNATNTPTFDTAKVDKNLQRWSITLEGNGHYKFVNVSNNGYLNENAKFGTNTYDGSWNTMNIYGDGINYAIQKSGNAGNGYWYLNAGTMVTPDNAGSITTPVLFPFELKLDLFAALDASMASAKILYDSSLTTAAQEPGKYPASSKSAFNDVLQYAVQVHDALNTLPAINVVLDSLNASVVKYKQSMYFLRNQLATGQYYMRCNGLYYTANSLSVYGFTSKLTDADSTTQIWNITHTGGSDGEYWIQNLQTQYYWNEWARSSETQAQLAGDGDWVRFNLFSDAKKYAIQKRAPGQTDQYFNGIINNGLDVNTNSYADPAYYIFELTPVNPGSVLPLRNIVLNAEKTNNNKVVLKWQTEQEANVKEFIAEHSSDGITYSPLIVTKSKNAAANNYSCTDPQPFAGDNYYRIKAVDIDGSYRYSAVKYLPYSATGLVWSVYQNPVVAGKLFIKFNSEVKNKLILVYDVTGKLKLSKTISAPGGVYALPLHGLFNAGMYVLRVQNEGSKTFIVQ